MRLSYDCNFVILYRLHNFPLGFLRYILHIHDTAAAKEKYKYLYRSERLFTAREEKVMTKQIMPNTKCSYFVFHIFLVPAAAIRCPVFVFTSI